MIKQSLLKAVFASFVLALGFIPAAGRAAPFLPAFSAATFTLGAPINHPFFPILDNKTRAFKGVGALANERFELTRVGAGPTILGVQTTARRDRAFVDERLVEETLDYYAQDNAGNVWYFGEDVTNFVYDATGKLLSTNNESAWRAGVDGAQPGFAMPADLTQGFNYYQEFASQDDALDQGTTSAVGQSVSIGLGSFSDVIRVLETSEIDPALREYKYYARGEGLILAEEDLDANFANPQGRVELANADATPTPVAPAPAGQSGGGGGGGCALSAGTRFDPVLPALILAGLLAMLGRARVRRSGRKAQF